MFSRTINAALCRNIRECWFAKGEPGPSAFGGIYAANPAGDGVCFPLGEYGPDLRADLNSPRGALLAIAVGAAPEPIGHKLIDHIVKTYGDIPPDVDRLVALRATLDGALGLEQSLRQDAAQPSSFVLVAAIAGGQLFAANSGACKGYHVRANGRIDAIRLEPSAQKQLEPGDSVLLCSSGLIAKLDEYDVALNLYSRSPQSAVRHLFDLSARRDAQGPKVAIVYGAQRSLRESVFGRSVG